MILDLFKLDGKGAVVTGANTGLGQGMAVALAEAGAKVVGVGRRSCAETKEKIEAFGGSFTEVLADLSTTAAVDTVLSGALDAYGRVDILVNNAGIIKRCDAVDVTEADWDTVIDINEKVVFFLSQAFAKQYIKQQDGGKIINVASMLSYQGGIRVPSYTASKSAIMGLTRHLPMNGQNTTLMSMRLRRVIWQRTIPHSFAVMMTEAMRFFQEFRQAAGEHRKICRAQLYGWLPKHRIM